ncbi:uncharacterized protein ACRADG_006836 [Cochliomyia hominivorax]
MEKKLIEFVRRHPYFYDKAHASYRNQLLKDEKWQEFSKATNIPVKVLKKRWKSLRDRYYRLLKTGEPKKTSYKYFENLQFLSGVNTLCKRKSVEIKDYTAEDELLTKSEDSFLLDEASFSSFYDNNRDVPLSPTSQIRLSDSAEIKGDKEFEEFIKLTPDQINKTTPFRAFLESIALTVEQANFDLNDIIRLQMSILQLVQAEVENRVINTA